MGKVREEHVNRQCKAVVININLGYNSDIMNRCKKLEEYAQFIAVIRAHLDEKYPIEEAVSMAIDECVEKGILEEILGGHREKVRSMVLTEYDEQAHIRNEREIAKEEGRAEGKEEGRKEGEDVVLRLMQLLIEAGREKEIARVTVDESFRIQLYKEFGLC